jgi:hypothetical protein
MSQQVLSPIALFITTIEIISEDIHDAAVLGSTFSKTMGTTQV